MANERSREKEGKLKKELYGERGKKGLRKFECTLPLERFRRKGCRGEVTLFLANFQRDGFSS